MIWLLAIIAAALVLGRTGFWVLVIGLIQFGLFLGALGAGGLALMWVVAQF
jgi:hypothetical protein